MKRTCWGIFLRVAFWIQFGIVILITEEIYWRLEQTLGDNPLMWLVLIAKWLILFVDFFGGLWLGNKLEGDPWFRGW